MLLIRAAGVNDVPLLLGFSREFAEFERVRQRNAPSASEARVMK